MVLVCLRIGPEMAQQHLRNTLRGFFESFSSLPLESVSLWPRGAGGPWWGGHGWGGDRDGQCPPQIFPANTPLGILRVMVKGAPGGCPAWVVCRDPDSGCFRNEPGAF